MYPTSTLHKYTKKSLQEPYINPTSTLHKKPTGVLHIPYNYLTQIH